MDRADNIMERLGFKKDAEDSIKAAFVKNLIKQAYGVEVPLPPQYQAPPPPPKIEDLSADVFAGRPLPEARVTPAALAVTGIASTLRVGINAGAGKWNRSSESAQLSFNFAAALPANEISGEIEGPPKVG